MAEPVIKGLEGVIAATTAISTVGVEGVGLSYRGYSLNVLAHSCVFFEEVAYLLLHGSLPTLNELYKFMGQIAAQRDLPNSLKSMLELIPGDASAMDVLRTGCSMLGALETETFSVRTSRYDERQQVEVAIRLLGAMPSILLYWYNFHTHGIRVQTSTSISESSPSSALPTPIDVVSIGEHWFQLLFAHDPETFQRLSPEVFKALNVSLIAYADHDLNASTFAARVTAATLSDFHSAVTAAIGTLKGPLHGGASEGAMELLLKIESVDLADQRLSAMFSNKEKILGFGHRIYKKGDPRSAILKEWAKKLSLLPETADPKCFTLAECVEHIVEEKKGLLPNLDFYTAVLYHLCGIPTKFFTPLFAVSRISGWAAHIVEQRANNRLIRPSSLYVGILPPRPFIPINDRKDQAAENGHSDSGFCRL